MTGPERGMYSRPRRDGRQRMWIAGWRTARTIQYTSGLTPLRRARSW